MIGLTSVLGTIIAAFGVMKFGRKTLFLIGQLGVAIPLFAAGYALYNEYAMASFVLICTFVLFY